MSSGGCLRDLIRTPTPAKWATEQRRPLTPGLTTRCKDRASLKGSLFSCQVIRLGLRRLPLVLMLLNLSSSDTLHAPFSIADLTVLVSSAQHNHNHPSVQSYLLKPPVTFSLISLTGLCSRWSHHRSPSPQRHPPTSPRPAYHSHKPSNSNNNNTTNRSRYLSPKASTSPCRHSSTLPTTTRSTYPRHSGTRHGC